MEGVTLHARPHVEPMSFGTFVKTHPPFSIAGDGYVSGPTDQDLTGPWLNYNHHEGCPQGMRSTCGQIQMDIIQGLYDVYQVDGNPYLHLFLEGCDEDCCTTWWELNNADIVLKTYDDPRRIKLKILITMEDALDCTAGAYPYDPKNPYLPKLAWIFDPYRRARASGEVDKKNPTTYQEIIFEVEKRITAFVHDKGKEIPLDTRYTKIRQGTGWVMVEEQGAQARTQMRADGHRVYVSVRTRPDGKYVYVVGKMGKFNLFDIGTVFAALNAVEGCSGDDRWNGSPIVGGSPRLKGSALPPNEVFNIMEALATGKMKPRTLTR